VGDEQVLESIQNPKGFHGVSPWLLTFVSGMQRSRGASSNVVKAKQIAKKLSNAVCTPSHRCESCESD
jgi:hypothetical protein